MLEWILILLAIAAIAAMFGFGRLSGVALSGAKLLVVLALVIFLLMALGVFTLA
ncbi:MULTISPECIES: DUF1328 family protein [Roseovarius]|jgi:uncharacterized membrane protein YtjA (UPF0391 family)|uniref:UPF0391 membrane protein DCS45_10555 n=1 Tax=Roseovarius nubinhibens TaxID=314263 RepID=A0A348WCN5_9RHOB|nr:MULTISPECIES: DUF1328 family protein [Roseovarius]MAO28142.1 DUF1328 domain-containing protein [Roseovarius sp.]MAZ21022.1 DUF1328 domain-containing protein [Roseovarius sp.]MBU3000218.1 DUF1328 domain-containing protein [Roseovarius nubinhibens]HAR52297.1 DUF1328 domain-containing protein [Roseovarius nubinhibens]|tara:strand:+ start:808 stop:969 length:162 start_codon:yes stop_codon:yes gene_type:complete